MYQEESIHPTTQLPDGLGSIAMDNNGGIALAYMKSNSTSVIRVLLTGRRSCDPLGTLPMVKQLQLQGPLTRPEATGTVIMQISFGPGWSYFLAYE